MRDAIYIAIAVAFFGICIAYVALCDRIIGPDALDASEPAEGVAS